MGGARRAALSALRGWALVSPYSRPHSAVSSTAHSLPWIPEITLHTRCTSSTSAPWAEDTGHSFLPPAAGPLGGASAVRALSTSGRASPQTHVPAQRVFKSHIMWNTKLTAAAEAGKVRVLLATIEEKAAKGFNNVNISTGLSCLAKVYADPPGWEAVAGHTQYEREANRLRLHRAVGLLEARLAGEAASLPARNLSVSIHSLAKLGMGARATYDAVAEISVARIGDFTPQGLANVAWAFAKAGHSHPELFEALGEAAVGDIEGFSPEGLAKLAWAFAKAGAPSPTLFQSIQAAAAAHMHEFPPQGLASLAWAFATAGQPSPQLFDDIAIATEESIGIFCPKSTATMAWAFARAGHVDPRLFDALEGAAKKRIDRFTPQGLGSIVWAFGKAQHKSPELFRAVADISMREIARFTPQSLSNLAWAFAAARLPHPHLFRAILTEVISRRPADLENIALSSLLLSFAKLQEPCAGLPELVLSRAGGDDSIPDRRLGRQERANVLYALALMDRLDGDVLLRVGSPLADEVDDLTEEELRQLFQCCMLVTQQQQQLQELGERRSAGRMGGTEEGKPDAGEHGPRAEEVVRGKEEAEQRDSPLPLPPRLYSAARKSWLATTTQSLESQLQLGMYKVLCGMGLKCESEALTEDGLFSVDVMVETDDGRKVAVEAEGPLHFTSRRPYRPMGSLLLRRKLLVCPGRCDALVTVPFTDWYDVTTEGTAAAEEYLQDKLQEVLKPSPSEG